MVQNVREIVQIRLERELLKMTFLGGRRNVFLRRTSDHAAFSITPHFRSRRISDHAAFPITPHFRELDQLSSWSFPLF